MKWIRFLVAAILIVAASLKIYGTTNAQTMYTALPGVAQVALVIVEYALGIWLASGLFVRPAAILTLALLSIFCGAIVVEMRKEHPQPCGCLGAEVVAANDPQTIRRNLIVSLGADVLLMGGIVAIFYGTKAKKTATMGESIKQNEVAA